MSGLRITGVVRGSTRFPDHPDHEGGWGLVGGEDVTASRSTFRSVGEAMTWCRKVLDGDVNPRWDTPGPLLTPNTGPSWSEARVSVTYGDERKEWGTEAHKREWYEFDSDRYGAVARTDRDKA